MQKSSCKLPKSVTKIWTSKKCSIFKLIFLLLALSTKPGIRMPLVFTLNPSDALDKPLHNKSSTLVTICMLQISLVWAQFISHAFQTPARMQIHVRGWWVPPVLPVEVHSSAGAASEDQYDHARGSGSSGSYLKSGRLQQDPEPQISNLLMTYSSELSGCDLKMLHASELWPGWVYTSKTSPNKREHSILGSSLPQFLHLSNGDNNKCFTFKELGKIKMLWS